MGNPTTSINMKASFLILLVILGLGFSSDSRGKDSCTQANVTITGIPCGELCAQLGKNYYWCRHSGDGSWDYCSLDEKHTRYGEECTSACTNEGKDYFWCDTADGWDYCSPKCASSNEPSEQ